MSAARSPSKVFLVGFMGTGKTTLGRLLAERLGWEFLDLDDAVEADAGTSIERIFAERGEPAFRALEAAVLGRFASRASPGVVACGGGTFCSPGNQRSMQRLGLTVWLDQPFDRIWRRRNELSPGRPLFTDEPELRALYDRRVPLYRLADLRLDVVEGGIDRALDELLGLLDARGSIG